MHQIKGNFVFYIYIQKVLIELVGKGHFDCRFDLLPPQMAQRIFSMF